MEDAQPGSAIAACITGQWRTFEQPCTGPAIAANILRPLRADTYVVTKIPKAADAEARLGEYAERARAVLRGVRIVRLNLTVQQEVRPSCSTAFVAGPSTFAVVRDLAICYEAMEATAMAGAGHARVWETYEWVIRMRTDWFVPFRVATLAPDPSQQLDHHARAIPRHVVQAAFLADRDSEP